MQTTTPAVGTIVEVADVDTYQYAVVTDPEPWFVQDADRPKVWVRYDNGCVVPVPEYSVSALTTDQVVARLNKR